MRKGPPFSVPVVWVFREFGTLSFSDLCRSRLVQRIISLTLFLESNLIIFSKALANPCNAVYVSNLVAADETPSGFSSLRVLLVYSQTTL